MSLSSAQAHGVAPDIRLIACDLDGTLLDAEHRISADFWPLLKQLKDKGIVFCPASGRQYHKLREQFKQAADGLVFIAENGTCVMRDDQELRSDCLDISIVHNLVRTGRKLQATGAQTGSVLCGKRAAYIEWKNPAFQAEVSRYYQRLEVVDDLLAVDDDFLKLAVFDFSSSQDNVFPAFAHFSATHQVVVSGVHWLDVMVAHANKGTGLRHVQEMLGIDASQTMAFGDYLNDLEMMDQAHYSFAMENAHPQLKARARFTAPANTDNGVVRAIRNLLGLEITST
jgi:Cof subfamily protein (haloacid dehalogenase superfamily)